MDADKIKKKLNGSILKGTKVKIDAARPKKDLVLDEEVAPKPKRQKEMKNSKKRKRGQETIPAVEIGDRSVKRGWTTHIASISKRDKRKDKEGKKSVVKSKYTTGPECLFKTVLPPNVAANIEKKEAKPEKKKRKVDKETVVHEFSKTTKYATFLRGPAGLKKKGVAEFLEGKGWVDEDENVVEEATKKKRNPQIFQKLAEKVETVISRQEDEDSATSSSSEEDLAESGTLELDTAPQIPQDLKEDSPTSSSGSSSEEDPESEASSSEDDSEAESSEPAAKTPKRTTLPPISTSHPQSSSGPPSGLSIKIPDSGITSTPITSEVHPLEALYKRPLPDALGSLPKPSASFSFFGADGDEDLEEEAQDQVPLTPFTQKDFEFRGIRSAAPTPDTAHANKRFIWPTDNDEDEEDEEVSSPIRRESPAKATDAKAGEPESDFQKWFYENRGEANRAWKKRRKAVAKEKRQRENRKRKDRAF